MQATSNAWTACPSTVLHLVHLQRNSKPFYLRALQQKTLLTEWRKTGTTVMREQRPLVDQELGFLERFGGANKTAYDSKHRIRPPMVGWFASFWLLITDERGQGFRN